MRICSLVLIAVSTAAFAATPAVSVTPACPEWPTTYAQPMVFPTITVHYDPNAPAALLKSANQLNLVLADTAFNRYDSRTIPMSRSNDGTWTANITPTKSYVSWYAIFFFRDENGRIDNNASQYWDALSCYHSQPSEMAVEAQAFTYQGLQLAPGIQRTRDLDRAIQILKTDLTAHPTAVRHYSLIWILELKRGKETPAAYEQVGNDIDSFLSAHGNDPWAMRQAVSFIAVEQQKLPPSVVERFRAALIALPETADLHQTNGVTEEVIPISRDSPEGARLIAGIRQQVTDGLAQFEYSSIASNYQDPHKRAAAYLAFAAKYPRHPETYSAYREAFNAMKAAGDIPGAEAAAEKWEAVDAPDPLPLVALAQLYMDQKIKPARTLGIARPG